jgi:succinate dehydrogenase / fumarate reductase iron-sulfur subunit
VTRHAEGHAERVSRRRADSAWARREPAALEIRGLDVEDRVPDLKQTQGIGYCNITKCCTKVCPEHITITDNAIIPLKERVVDRFYDPVTKLLRVITGR